MSKSIYTYTDLAKIAESDSFNAVKEYPIVTVTSDIRKGLKGVENFDKVEGVFSKDNSVIVKDFRTLALAIDEQWAADHSKFNAVILLSEFIRKKMEECKDIQEEYNWLLGCLRNLDSILATVVLLEEACVSPEDISADNDRNLSLLLEAWYMLRDREPSIGKFHEKMCRLTTKSAWEPILQSAFGKTGFDAIVFQGFYYITPYQQHIMDLLEKAGYDLIYLIPYDVRYPFVYEIWDQTYDVKNGYPDKSQWHIEKSNATDVYGDIFTGKDVDISNKLRFKEYASEVEFVNDVKHIKEKGYTIYAADHLAANKLLKDYYPESYGERKILAYPIGQFISNLNRMWDDDLQTIALDDERLIECFSSGWLALEGVNGKQYMQELFYLLPFFNGCKGIEEWEKRIAYLKQIKSEVIDAFNADLDLDDNIARWQKAVGNPLANFSMFAVDGKKVDLILELIKQLLDMAKELFGNNSIVDVRTHISKLDYVLKKHEMSNELYEEERELVTDIFVKLSDPGGFDQKCSPSDIARAMDLYMTGKLEQGEIQTNRVGLVSALYFVDAACIKNKGKVHICMADVNSTPGGNKEYVWPLTKEAVVRCYSKTGNRLIENMMQIMEANGICNRYFIYSALKNKDVCISWVSSMGDKLLAPSPYIKLICEATGIKVIPPVRNTITSRRVQETNEATPNISVYSKEKMPINTVKEAKMDYAACPMRYVFGYVLEECPSYQSEFQQNYAINALISAISALMKGKGVTVDQAYKNVVALFPSLRKLEKRQVYDYIEYESDDDIIDFKNRTKCGDNYYTDERLKLHFPNEASRNTVLGKYAQLMTPDGRDGMQLYDLESDPVICTFCPHIVYCRNATYSKDQENYYD